MMTTFEAPQIPTVASCVAEARARIERGHAGEAHLSQGPCVDWLLDCLNASVRTSVRAVIAERLSEIAHVNLVTRHWFVETLDHIQLGLQVDAAFDHLEVRL